MRLLQTLRRQGGDPNAMISYFSTASAQFTHPIAALDARIGRIEFPAGKVISQSRPGEPLSTSQTGTGVLGLAQELLTSPTNLLRAGNRAVESAAQQTAFQALNTAGAASNLPTAILAGANSRTRPGFPGEHHAVLKLPSGKLTKANWMGPGTAVLARLKRGDPPVSLADTTAMAHDLRYTTAKSAKDIRHADQTMVKRLQQIRRNGSDASANTALGISAITTKMGSEDLGVINMTGPFSFAGDLPSQDYQDASEGDKQLLKSTLADLTQAGFGEPPAEALRRKILKMTRTRKRKAAGRGRSGRGVPRSTNAALARVISKLSRTLGIVKSHAGARAEVAHLPHAEIKRIVGNSSSITDVARKVIPRLFKIARAHHASSKGPGRSSISKTKRRRLVKSLAAGLAKAVKARRSGTRGAKGGGILGDFFKGFKKGFTAVFKPAAKLLSKVAPVFLPGPEGIAAGLVLNATSDAL
jgi:hypothetical protein